MNCLKKRSWLCASQWMTGTVSYKDQSLAFQGQMRDYENRERELLVLTAGCFGTRSRACGLSLSEGPNPWLSEDGRPCRGYATFSTRPHDYCAYWEAEFSPNAAPDDMKQELLDARPTCLNEDATEVLKCSGKADMTQRAGIYEMARWERNDRRYCEFKFFRSRVTPQHIDSIERCRSTIINRTVFCNLECDGCKSMCTSETAKAVASIYRCTVGGPYMGVIGAAHTSDAGEMMRNHHGANRTSGRVAIPEDVFLEQYAVLIQNSIVSPKINRNAISCRKSHHESPTGKYTPSIDSKGRPTLREGFMVGCTTDTDCYSRCGDHPLHGQAYVCTKNASFYDYAVVLEDKKLNFTQEPWENGKFDYQGEEPGVCTDIRRALEIEPIIV